MSSSLENNTQQMTVLAWLQKELSLYSELLLISPIRELAQEEENFWNGKPLLCLAHHYFPESIPNLVEQLQQQSETISLYQLFQQKLGVPIPIPTEQHEDYLCQIQQAIHDRRQEDSTSTLHELHIGNTITNNTDNNSSNTLSAPATGSMQDFEKCLVNLSLPLNKLFHQLVELSMREEEGLSSSTTRSPSPRINTTTTTTTIMEESSLMNTTDLPMKSRLSTITTTTTSSGSLAVDDTASLASSGSSSVIMMTLEEIENTLNTLESRDLVDFKSYLDAIPDNIKQHPDIAVRISAIDATHAALHLQLHKGDMLRTTIQFTNTAAYIRNELEFIQAKMLKTTTTDVGIQDLESRAKVAGVSINSMATRFKQLLDNDPVTLQEYLFLQDKFRLICNWVDDVRVWFVEAERIRKWIEERIKILEEKPTNMNSQALEEVELDYEVIPIDDLNREQEALEKEVEVFDKEDMTRLRAHVKALTGGNKDLSPADTTTIEITFTTLMTLDRLMHLLRRHNYELQMLTLRMYWEQEYHVSVTWVRATGEKVRLFVQHKARWRPPSSPTVSDNAVEQQQREEIIQQLIDFEKQSQAFDQGQFTTTVNMYQDLDDACNIELPSHLESRQVAIEEAFEELTNRIAFARQVVEQFLVVTDFLDRADKLKMEGDELRQEITLAAEQHNSLGRGSPTTTNDFSEKVTLFQENAVRLVTGVASRIPYPEATHPTDQQGNDDANEVIRMIIGARKSALVLFGEALDHSLAAYRRALQLQKRGKQLGDEISRLTSWVDERMRSIKKSEVDVFVGKCALDETDLARLKKERDGQVAKLNGIKENEMSRLQENIQALQASSSQPPTNPNTVALVTSLNENMVALQGQLNVLEDALQVHSLCLDILGKRISWETQHYKASQWISNTTFQVWEFVARKAQWRAVDAEFVLDRDVVQQEFKVLENKVQEFHIDQLTPVDQTFNELANGFNIILDSINFDDDDQPQDNITPEHVQRRQGTLDTSFNNLCDLIEFANEVLSQHTALTDFSTQVSDLGNKGRGLLSDIQAAMDGVMKLNKVDEHRQGFVIAVKEFSQDVVQLWMQSGSQLPYPQCPEDARATRPSTNDDEISTEVATIIYKMYAELQDLAKRMSELLQKLDISIVYRLKLEQWCTEADDFTGEIKSLMNDVERMYTFDLVIGSVLDTDTKAAISADTYCEKANDFTSQLIQLKADKYEPLVHHLQDLKNSLEQDDGDACASVNPLVTQVSMTALDTSWQTLSQSVELFCCQARTCHHRVAWESLYTKEWDQMNQIQDGVREWINEKNLWLSSSSSKTDVLDSLVFRMQVYDSSIQHRVDTDLPPLKSAFQDMVVSYKTLLKASSDNMVNHVSPLEDKQDDLEKLSTKLQDMVSTQLSEIQVIKARHDWESSVDRELKTCAEKTLETESFIRDYARWSPSSSSDVDVKPIHASAAAQVDTLSSLLNDLNHLQTKNSSLLQTEMIFKRKSALESTTDRIQSHVAFMDQVLEQRQLIVSSLDKVSELEVLAESIKTRFLSFDLDGKEQAQLDEYNSRVSDLAQQSGQVMVYPVRHYRDHDAQCREQDEAHNAVINDMIVARKARLDELGSTLESILKSKERLSRCKAAEETYMAEAQVVKDWIEAKSLQVEEASSAAEPSTVVEDLRTTVTAIGAIQSAAMTYTSTVQGLKESANQCITMIQQQGEEDDGILGRIQSTQASINASWDDLSSKIRSTKSHLSINLRHAEYIKCVESFHTQCSSLQANVMQMDLASVTEEITGQWQNDIQMLESTFIEQIRSRLSKEKIKCASPSDKEHDSVSQELLKEMSDMLTVVLKDFDAFKKIIGERTTEANHHRFKIEYFTGADALDTCMKETRAALDDLKSASSRRVIHGHSVEEDKATVKKVTDTYEAIVNVFENQHHEMYDEQRSFYRFLQLNKVSDLSAVDKHQADLEQQWKQLKMDVANDKQHVDGVSQWFDLHVKLNEMQSEALSGIFQRLDQMVLEEDTMPTFLEQDAALLKLLESRLSACWDIATSLVDGGNTACFQARHDDLQKDVKKAETLLDQKKDMAQKHVDFVSCQQMIKDIQVNMDQVVDTVKSRLGSLVIADESSKYLEQLYRNSSMALATTESQQKKIVSQSTTVAEPLVSSLQDKYADDDRVGTIKSDLAGSLESLNYALQTEQAVNDMMRRVLGHAKSAENISTWIENCNSATNQVLGNHLDEGEAALEIANLSQKLVDFETVIDSFNDLSTSILLLEHSNNDVVNKLVDIVNKTSASITEKWIETQDQLKSVEAIVEKTARGVAIARKIRNIMALVGETREYASSIKLFDSDDNCSVHTQDKIYGSQDDLNSIMDDDEKSAAGIENIGDAHASTATADSDVDDDKTKIGASVEEDIKSEDIAKDDVETTTDNDKQIHQQQQLQPLLSMLRQSEVENIQQTLQSLEADVKPQIQLDLDELNTMISEFKDIDSTFIRQHQEVQESVASLLQLLGAKHTDLDRAMDIGQYLTVADDIEILQSSLEEAVSKSAPHHATLIGTGFSRTDLQAKLIELDARFKYYERKIVQSLASAKEQALVVIDKKDTESILVEAHLQEMEAKWELVKKQFKTRKIELSRTIDTSLDPKEQHARIRKSSLPTRKASSLLRDRADLSISRLSPTLSSNTSSSTSSSTKSSSNISRLNPGRSTSRYLTPPLQHQPSKSATHLKSKTGRLLTTPVKPPLNSYVADPDNDLDIEIGRIVNETPYRVKVKMVPGEVGRYWFGNMNPKLAYCRVLKSKMVMVRVGGGWTELSQFLRDHALLEGDFIPRSRRNTTNARMMIPEEEEPKSPTIQEGFIETRRDFNRPQNQRHRSESPNTQPQQHRSSTTTNSSGSRSNTTSSYPTGSPSHSASTTATSGYKDGDMFIAVDQHGNQLEVKMRKAASNDIVGRNMSTSTANTSGNDYTRRRIARRKEKPSSNTNNNTSTTTTAIPTTTIPAKTSNNNTSTIPKRSSFSN